MPALLVKHVDARELIVALDDLERILKAQCKTPQKRQETLSYVLYRGLEAIRAEWEIAQRRLSDGPVQ